MLFKNIKKNKAFTLIETLVGVAVFLVISTAVYQAYTSLFKFISLNQYKILALNLANEQFEIIRNLSYNNVGIPGGIPNGKIPHVQNFVRGGISFVATTTIRNIDLEFDGTIGGSPNDLSPADNKLVSVEVDCLTCDNFQPIYLTTTVAPKNLETSSTNGALLIKVFDANGVPVSNANIHIENNKVSPAIIIDDVTDSTGLLQIVDAPPGSEAYEITVTKSGYSTDKTYTTGNVNNPSPIKPHATVVLQQLTQISFSIDRLSAISFSSVNTSCVAIPNIDFSLKGSKLIGTNTFKYSNNLSTNGSGIYSNNAMEWDSYTVSGTDADYDIIGINPLNSISLNPNSNQDVTLIVNSKNPKSLLITVKDSSTQLPVTNATVQLTDGDDYNNTKVTGRGSINQSSWSPNLFTYNDGNIDVFSPEGELKLLKVFESYNSNGVLESSTIDTGSISNFYNFSWLPTDQPVGSGMGSARFQFATNATITEETTWQYKGPDGTSATYYNSPDTPLASIHNGDRYARYKIYMSTLSPTSTPNISDISFTVTSACTPPGQVIFSGLSNGDYTINVSKNGYTSESMNINVNSNWKEQEIILSP